MKTIGLLGGMSWESTELYYRLINEGIKQELGGLNSADIAMRSVNFQDIETLQHQGNWQAAGQQLAKASQEIEAAGADFLLICTNTMHKVADQIEAAINIPLIHLADATANAIKEQNLQTIGFLGTSFSMEQDFYVGRLKEKHGLNVLIPNKDNRQSVHDIIYQELCLGVINERSRRTYLNIMQNLEAQGAQAIIEGCTEIGMLVKQEHTNIKLFDTTVIHAQAAVKEALS